MLLFGLETREMSPHYRGKSGCMHIQDQSSLVFFFKRLTSCEKGGRENSEITLFGCWMKAKCKTLKDQEAGKLKHKAEEKTTSSPCIY